MNKAQRKRVVRQLISEYAGRHFMFMEKFLDGGFESYVYQNLLDITHKKSFGKLNIREEYKTLSAYQTEQKIMRTCEGIIEFVNTELPKYKFLNNVLIRE